MRKTFAGKAMVITGASSGLGEAIAVEVAARGARLALVARRTDRLDQLAARLDGDIEVHVLGLDLRHQENAEKLVTESERLLGGIDYLVLNAGVAGYRPVAYTPMEEARHVMEVNYFSPLASIRAALPGLRSRPGSHIVVVSSYCAYTHLPMSGAYAASKAAVASLARILSTESPPPPDITVVYPGIIHTEMYHKVESSVPVMQRFSRTGIDADVAARKVLNALARRKPTLFLTRPAILMDRLMRIAPNTVDKTTRAIFRRIPERLLGPPDDHGEDAGTPDSPEQ